MVCQCTEIHHEDTASCCNQEVRKKLISTDPSLTRARDHHQQLREVVVEMLKMQSFGGVPWNELSKNSQKKRITLKIKSMQRKEKRRKSRKIVDDQVVMRSRELKQLRLERVREAMVGSRLRVAVDCSWGETQSAKQNIKLVSQVRLMHRYNMSAEFPARIYLTGLQEGGKIWQEVHRQAANGWDSLLLAGMTSLPHTQYFDWNEIVYLSPDSPQTLTAVDPTKVYIIGGLVDDSITRGLSLKKAEQEGVVSMKLPVMDYMNMHDNNSNLSILCLNQVLGILLDITAGRDWVQALASHVPRRKALIKPNFL